MQYNFSNILERISFYRVSGITKFAILDIHKNFASFSYIHIKQPFYQISKEKPIDNYNILHSEIIDYGNDYSIITECLNNFASKHKLEETFLIIGINEFRFKTIKIDKDIDDKELWFVENTDKFLPESQLIDDFLFSYERYYENDENEYYYINIARKRTIESITDACQIKGFTIINISTFPLAIHSLNFTKKKKTLFLNITFDRIIYSFSDGKNILFYGESFLTPANAEISDNNNHTDLRTINDSLREIKQNLSTLLPISKEELNIYFSSEIKLNKEIKHQIQLIFSVKLINANPLNISASHVNLICVLNKLLTGSDNSINLLPLDIESENRELIEKKSSFKLIISSGALLVFLLLSIYFVENLINTQIQNNETNLVEIDVKAKMVKNYEIENSHLINNIALLGELKGEKFINSKILYSIINGVGKKGCLTKFLINESDNGVRLNLMGISYSQKDVTDIVNRLEELNNFNNVSLEYANVIEKSKYRSKVVLPRKAMINFSISADYYEN